MSARITSLSRDKQIALVCAGLMLVAAAGYFLLIAPKRATANDLKAETAKVQAQIEQSKASPFGQALPAVRSASMFKLAKAMPDGVGMSNIVLELNQLAVDSGITFDEITPQEAAGDTTFDVQPITVAFTGNFYSLSDFLLRLRNLVRVEHGKLLARGRMFAVSDVKFSEADQKFPFLTANLTIDAFVPSAQQAAAAADTTAAATTSATQTTPTASASGASTGSSS